MKTFASMCYALAVSVIVTPCMTGAVVLSLRVEPEEDLPGLPRVLRVEARNESAVPLELPAKVSMQVTPSSGEPFIAYTFFRGLDRVTQFSAPHPIMLGPGEKRDLSFVPGATDAWFAADARLLPPGTYRLQLVADPGLDSGKMEERELLRVLDQPGLVSPVISNETPFIVQEPTGGDLAVWNRIRTLTAPTMWTVQLAEEIWRDFPDSRYAAYAIPSVNGREPEEAIAILQKAIARAPDRATADWHRLEVARQEMFRAARLEVTDLEGALAAYDRARTLLEVIARQSGIATQKERAAAMLDDIPTREEILRTQKRVRGESVDSRITIAVDCVAKTSDGKFIVWFGVAVDGTTTKTFPIGSANKFTPPPFDRAQPTEFRPGRRHLAFSVLTDEPQFVWHLDRENLVVRPRETEECPEETVQ